MWEPKLVQLYLEVIPTQTIAHLPSYAPTRPWTTNLPCGTPRVMPIGYKVIGEYENFVLGKKLH